MNIGGNNVSNTLYIGGQRPFTSADKSNLDKNTSARHEHDNKLVLDGITEEKVSQWDAGGGTVDVSGKEDKSNKVTAITGDETADKYPNVQAVIAYLQSHGMTEAKLIEWLRNSIVYADAISTNFVGVPSWAAIALSNSGITLEEVLKGKVTEEKVREIFVEYFSDSVTVKELVASMLLSSPAIHLLADTWNNIVKRDKNGNSVTLEQTLATKSNEMKLLYRKKITADDGNVSFIEFLPETPLKKIYVYTFCPKDTTANTNKLFFKFGSGSYITDSLGHANIATDSNMWGAKEFDLEQHKHIIYANNIKSGNPGSCQYRNAFFPYSGDNTFWTAIYDTSTFEVKNLLSGVKFSTNSESVYFPLNTIMMVWGC